MSEALRTEAGPGFTQSAPFPESGDFTPAGRANWWGKLRDYYRAQGQPELEAYAGRIADYWRQFQQEQPNAHS